jgi:hypothetical protein
LKNNTRWMEIEETSETKLKPTTLWSERGITNKNNRGNSCLCEKVRISEMTADHMNHCRAACLPTCWLSAASCRWLSAKSMVSWTTIDSSWVTRWKYWLRAESDPADEDAEDGDEEDADDEEGFAAVSESDDAIVAAIVVDWETTGKVARCCCWWRSKTWSVFSVRA